MAPAFTDYLGSQDITQRVNYDVNPRALRGEDRVEFIRWNVLAAIKELGEMLDSVDGWKPWQNKRDHAGEFKDRDEFAEDGVDALKFVANLLLAAGVTDQELSRIWAFKTQLNAKRQEDGYAGVGADHRDLDFEVMGRGDDHATINGPTTALSFPGSMNEFFKEDT
jgi:hypothetical protein